MKIASWNINGIRAVSKKDSFWNFLEKDSPDIIGFQEIKIQEHQMPMEIYKPHGYYSYFSCGKRPGYSGVAVYSKIEAKSVSCGIGIEKFDDEGRILRLDFDDFIYFNVYFPNGGSGEERLKFKLEFYDEFLKYLKKLLDEGKKVIVGGDYNTAHNEIDLARPKDNVNISGFMPCERVWVDEYLKSGFVDIFRQKNPDLKDKYTWWSMRTAARQRNVGWRIDYFLISPNLLPHVQDVYNMENVMGSDHCPIILEINN